MPSVPPLSFTLSCPSVTLNFSKLLLGLSYLRNFNLPIIYDSKSKTWLSKVLMSVWFYYVLLYINSLLLLSHFSRVRLCATPEMTAHQVPPSLGFSRQEHWSGLPFPSPMHESEVAQSGPTLSNPMDCSLPGPSSMGFSRQEYWSGVPLPSPLILYAPLFLVTSSIMPSFSLLKSHLSRPSSIIIPSL